MKSALLTFRIFPLLVCGMFGGEDLFAQGGNFVKSEKLFKQQSGKVASYNEKLQHQPLLFIENRGQVADVKGNLRPEILFTAQSGGAKLYFTGNAIHYQFTKVEHSKEHDSLMLGKHSENFKLDVRQKTAILNTHRFTVELLGANLYPSIKKELQSAYFENYYLGHCPNGIVGVKSYQKITYENVYPGIDWVIYSNEGFMKYDFVVHKGADRSLIKLKINDADNVSITSSGELLIKTKLGDVKEKTPVSFTAAGKKVNTRFVQNKDGTIGFDADAEKGIELRIDPSVVWATYYGGSEWDKAFSCAVDASNNVYMSGETYSASGIATAGGFDNTISSEDVFLVKFNSSGIRLWATYYGSSGQEFEGAVAVDASGNIYVAGVTNYATGIASGGFQNTFGGYFDAFLVKFNNSGNRLWATYYGGASREDNITCTIDGSNNIYLAGTTTSPDGIASGGFQNTYQGNQDAFLVKFNSTGARLWATYYGGIDYDDGMNCAVDGDNNIYLAGSTKSSTGIASGGFQNTYQGNQDAFLVKFNSTGARLWATYYGGSGLSAGVGYDEGMSCAVDGSNNVYLAGSTTSPDGIASGGFQNIFYTSLNGYYEDAFLVKFNSTGARLWATYYGNYDDDDGLCCAVDGSNNVYLVGFTNSTAGIACGGFQNTKNLNNSDVFIVKFNSEGSRYWGSYFDSGIGEVPYDCIIDASDNLYVCGDIYAGFVTLSGGHQSTAGGSLDALLVKIEGSVIANPALNLVPSSGILYVDKTKSGNGSSWANAAPELAHALKAAQTNPLITQIWVAKGTYTPMHNPSVSASCPDYNHIDNVFLLVNNVKVYGGFSGNGTETSITQRSPALYPTILNGSGRYHIVISAGAVGTAELNGFTIENGKANGTGSITVNSQSIFRGNGGGVYISNSSPRIENCIIRNNSASTNGGGLFAILSSSNFIANRFSGNTSEDGGGIYFTNCTATLVNCLISGNTASGNGAGLYSNALLGQTPVIRNSTIVSNRSTGTGGGLYYTGITSPGSPPLVYNSIIYGNRFVAAVSNFVTSGATNPEVRYSIIEDNNGYTNSGNNLVGGNPQFVNAKDASLAPFSNGNYSVSKCSPAINTGNNTYISGFATDLAGNTRILNTTVDRGAYENNSAVSAAPDMSGIVYVDKSKAGDGSTWENAVPELADALLAARTNTSIDQIWVAAGTYYPLYDIGFTCVPVDARDKAFVLVNNVRLYGGFAGGETLLSQRNFSVNETVLSGDIGITGDRTDNSYHVVVSAGAVGSALLNGFFIQDGEATGTGTVNINAITFAKSSCGGMYIINSSPSITNCTVKNNKATSVAGGIYVSNSDAVFTNCLVAGNASTSGGSSGGGIFNNNPLAGSTTEMILRNCTITGNRAGTWGGVSTNSLGTGKAKIYNCIIYGNETNAGAVNSDLTSSSSTSDDPDVYYSIIGNAAASGVYTSVTSNSTANPLFNYPTDASLAPTSSGNYRVQKCSPAINTGNNSYSTSTRDLDANDRIAFTTVDKGAFEKVLALPDANGIVYVDSSNIESEGDGSSWDKAITHLGDALKAAKFDATIQQIWTAKGIYKPIWRADFTTNLITDCPVLTDRDNAFVLVNNVKVYGGFAGGETDTTGRDFEANKVILSGDFNDDDVVTGAGFSLSITNNSENAYHVMISSGAIGVAGLDGVSILRGNANGPATPITVNGNAISKANGGGMVNRSSSPYINNCSFINNSTSGQAGGLDNITSSSLITNTKFTGNFAGSGGGGIHNSFSSLSILNCSFTGNSTSSSGGAMVISLSDPIITNCIFSENFSSSSGGGIVVASSAPIISNSIFKGNSAASGVGGGLFSSSSSSPIITNSIFTGNFASSSGGAIYSNGATALSLTNSTIAANRSTANNGGIVYALGTLNVKNCIVWGNTATAAISSGIPSTTYNVSNSIVQGGYTGIGNYDIDPLFIATQLESAAPTTAGDYRLQPCSPAINIGNNEDVSGTLDLDNNQRIVYDEVDLGAYEQQTNIYVDGKYTTWKGNNTNWHDKINWCGGFIPTYEIDATVPATIYNPVLSAAGETKDIVLDNGTSIETTSAGQLTINGTYSNNGSTITNNGNWVMAGNANTQTFPGILATVNAMNKLEINNPLGITLDKSFGITGSLVPTRGNILVDNVEITLKSSDTATASVDIIQDDASISYNGTGAFIVERYIHTGTAPGQHAKTWQFLATPTTGQTIYQAWQEGGSAPAGFGTWITGTGTGFDAATALPSLKFFNEAAVNWTAVTNTGNALVNKLGYMLFVRGDRTVTTFNGTPNNTILRSTGQIFTPSNPPPSVAVSANKFQTFGNPYASRIEFNSVYNTSTGINDVFYVWDPKLAGSYNVGGYQTISGITGYIPTVGTLPAGNAATDYYPAGIPSPYIESGQAVFVKGNATGGNINFNEQVKVSGNRLVNRPVNPNNPLTRRQFLFTSLFMNTGVIADGNIIAFERGFGNDVNGLDAEKIMNGGENFGLIRDGKILAVEAHEPVNPFDTIFFSMNNLRKQPYQLRFAPVNMGSLNHQPYLIDRFSNTVTLLSLTDSSFVDFTVNDNVHSSAGNRFYIVFKKKGKQQLIITDTKSIRQNGFEPLYHKQVTEVNKAGITVYPNPVIDRNIQLWFKAMPEGVYALKLYSASGQLVHEDKVIHQGGDAAWKVSLSPSLPNGIYRLEVISGSGEKSCLPLQL